MQEENRLTQSDDLGNWGVKGLLWKNLYAGNTITEEMYEILYGCLEKLKDYEETGFSPEEVEEFKDALAAEPQCKELYTIYETVRSNRLDCEVPSDCFEQIKEVRVIDERTEETKVFKECTEDDLQKLKDIYSIEKLKEIDKFYLEKCEEVNRLKAYIQKLEKEK